MSYTTTTFDIAMGGTPLPPSGPVTGGAGVLQQFEEGWKDTIQVSATILVSVDGQFGGATGNVVYHCHILDHETERMIRPFLVPPTQGDEAQPPSGWRP